MYRTQKVVLTMLITALALWVAYQEVRLNTLEAKFEDASTHVCVIKETKEDSFIVEMSR